MSIDEIVEYVMHTPYNSNPRVLKDMLGQLAGASTESETGGDQYCEVLELTENDFTIEDMNEGGAQS